MKVRIFGRSTSAFNPELQFQLAGRIIDPQIRQVTWKNGSRGLEPKSIDLLFVLIAAEGRPVSRTELVDKAWRGAAVSEDAVQRAVGKLRRALGDDTKDPAIIGTLPKSGYRLLAAPKQKQYVEIPNWGVAAAMAVILASAGWLTMYNQAKPKAPEFDFTFAKAITSSPGYELAPALAPTGNLLAYVAYNDERNDPSLDLLMLDRNTGKTETLADGPGVQAWPVWSPDGKSLVYVNGFRDKCEVVLLSMVDRSKRVVTSCINPNGVQLSWGGDGQTIYILDAPKRGAKKQLYTLNLINSIREQIAIDVGDVVDLAISPSGKKLALVRERIPDRHDIYLFDLHSGKQRRITNESHDIEGISWSSDDSNLIISTDRAGLFRLWSVRVSDGQMTAIAAPGMNASFPEIRPGAGQLVYQVWDSQINLQLIGAGQNDDDRIARSNRWEWSPAPSPDGKSVAFLSNRDGSTDLWVANIDGSKNHRVAAFDTSFDTVLSWAPDGAAIVLSALKGDHFSLVIVDLENEALSWIHHPNTNLRDPFFSPDGRALFYASDEGDGWTIRTQIMGIDDSETIVASGALARLSHDGAALYIVTEDGALDKLDLDSGVRENVISNRRSGISRAWTPTREGIAFLDGGDTEGYRIMVWNKLAKEISMLKKLDGEVLESSVLAENIDGGIWIARMDSCASDLWEAPLSH